jgi:hypothetical protein
MGSRAAQALIVGPGYLHVVLHIAYSDNPAASRTTRLILCTPRLVCPSPPSIARTAARSTRSSAPRRWRRPLWSSSLTVTR